MRKFAFVTALVLATCPLAAEAGVLINRDHINPGESIYFYATPEAPDLNISLDFLNALVPPGGFFQTGSLMYQAVTDLSVSAPGSVEGGADETSSVPITFSYKKPGTYLIDWQFSQYVDEIYFYAIFDANGVQIAGGQPPSPNHVFGDFRSTSGQFLITLKAAFSLPRSEPS